MGAIRTTLLSTGSSEKEVESLLAADNFTTPATYSLEAVLGILKTKGIDIDADPDFKAAQLTPKGLRVNTLVDLLKDLERGLKEPLGWREIIDYETSALNVEIVRAPSAGIGKQLREETAARCREVAIPAARSLGNEHVRRVREAAEAQASQEPPKRSKGPGSKR